MQAFKLFLPKIKPVVPYLYFAIIILLSSYPRPGYLMILFAPLILQMIYKKKVVDMLLGMLLLFCSIWFCLAMLSELGEIIAKYGRIPDYSILLVGIPVTCCNLLMSVWLIIKGSQVEPDTNNTLVAA